MEVKRKGFEKMEICFSEGQVVGEQLVVKKKQKIRDLILMYQNETLSFLQQGPLGSHSSSVALLLPLLISLILSFYSILLLFYSHLLFII